MLHANYAADKLLQKRISTVKNVYILSAVSRLSSPLREKFQSFTLDEENFLSMVNCHVLPHAMRAMIMCSLYYGHPGRDALLGMISEIWWPKIHRKLVEQARLREQAC